MSLSRISDEVGGTETANELDTEEPATQISVAFFLCISAATIFYTLYKVHISCEKVKFDREPQSFY